MFGPYPSDPTHFGGGVETSFFNLVQGLSSLDDVEPHVVTLARGLRTERRTADESAPVTYLPSGARFNNLTLYRNDRKLLADAYRRLRPDIVHAQDAVAYGYVALKAVKGSPVFVSVHGVVREELKHLRHPLDRIRTSVFRIPIQRYCIRHAPYLLQPSRYPEEYFHADIRGRIVVVGNPIADLFFTEEGARHTGRIFYAGGVSVGKRIVDLIEALALVRRETPAAHVRIAGHLGDVNYVAEVRARIKSLGLEDAVVLLGSLSPAALVDEYRSAALFVLPSGQENSPMVVGEAMAGGLPVVATDVGGVASLVDDGVTGLLVGVGDVEQLARKISRLLEGDDERAAFGVAARAVADARFRPVQVAMRVRDVYREALDGDRTGS